MERFIKGDIVVASFPYSDFSQLKRRPALILATLDGDDLIACQITSQQRQSQYAIPVSNEDFAMGSLRLTSYVRPEKLLTINRQLIIYKVGSLKSITLQLAIAQLIKIFTK